MRVWRGVRGRPGRRGRTWSRSDAVAAGCSGGRRGAAGPDAPLAARHFALAGSQGRRGEGPGKEGFARKVVGIRPMRYLGEFTVPNWV